MIASPLQCQASETSYRAFSRYRAVEETYPQIAQQQMEEEVYALLNQYFPVQDQATKGEIKGIQYPS